MTAAVSALSSCPHLPALLPLSDSQQPWQFYWAGGRRRKSLARSSRTRRSPPRQVRAQWEKPARPSVLPGSPMVCPTDVLAPHLSQQGLRPLTCSFLSP